MTSSLSRFSSKNAVHPLSLILGNYFQLKGAVSVLSPESSWGGRWEGLGSSLNVTKIMSGWLS